MTSSSQFWDALAPHHAALENNYFDLSSVRRIKAVLQSPVLVVGAGQGLIVEELRKDGFQCEGVDLSPEMVRYAQLRRGLTLMEANAKAMPFEDATYQTIIYATGVVDFMDDEDEIRCILNEGRRVVNPSGKIFVAFYRLSDALEEFVGRVGLLKDNLLAHRESLEMYLLNPVQMLNWVAKRAGVSHLRAAAMMFRMSAQTTLQEKRITFRMQHIFRDRATANALVQAAPEKQPYRNAAEIKNLFQRLSIPIKELRTLSSCSIVQI